MYLFLLIETFVTTDSNISSKEMSIDFFSFV